MINFTDQEASWFKNISRVPLGYIVELAARTSPSAPNALRSFCDRPQVRMKSDADYIARASELLDEGVRACLAGFASPGRPFRRTGFTAGRGSRARGVA